MGTPKQLLHRIHSLICHAATVAIASIYNPDVVVPRANSDRINQFRSVQSREEDRYDRRLQKLLKINLLNK